ncbi:DUF302 domain-containing protein [Muricauda sp. SCSIO 64092]|uniref:DUF302 domain-containing protein n=1 Tax=Allomuricauda sp. SCSIO 64092 TaxID=2908842 RepID=UPI001FF39D43|nr:DUF302 domain-containing protein [Muricauda sp. SCSIO 64092]UOY08662.1 DUF302 domain-containing protein [Muricauda sp. SCSIO 64092]
MDTKGIITKISRQNFSDTYRKLKETIDNNPNLNVMLELDHQANARKNGLELNPSKLIIFGNPNLGTPLMQSAQTLGLDLPQKVLVHENGSGIVHLSYNDPQYLKNRHDVSDADEILSKVASALDKITTVSADT